MNQLQDLGYAACIDAQLFLLVSFHFAKRAFQEIKETGDYSAMTHEDNVAARQAIEDLIGLEEYYAIEEQTVEGKQWGKR
jgi:2-methylisocitrate lyase-like PEP mutase family enzyme